MVLCSDLGDGVEFSVVAATLDRVVVDVANIYGCVPTAVGPAAQENSLELHAV